MRFSMNEVLEGKLGGLERIRTSDLLIMETIYRPDRGSLDPLGWTERVDSTSHSVYPEGVGAFATSNIKV